MTDQVGPDGKLRVDFTIIADASREGGGWNIDDVCVVTAGSSRGPSSALLSLAVLLVIRRRRA